MPEQADRNSPERVTCALVGHDMEKRYRGTSDAGLECRLWCARCGVRLKEVVKLRFENGKVKFVGSFVPVEDSNAPSL